MQYINVRDSYMFRKSLIGGGLRLGGGLYSEVYEAGPGRVLKIGSLGDSGYMAYMRAMQTVQTRSKYLPNLMSVPVGVNVNIGNDEYGYAGFYYVYLESLTPIDQEDERHASLYFKVHRAICRAFEPRDEADRELASKQYAKNKAFAGLIDVLKAAHSLGERRFDLHDGNMMFRGNELVVTDPFSS